MADGVYVAFQGMKLPNVLRSFDSCTLFPKRYSFMIEKGFQDNLAIPSVLF